MEEVTVKKKKTTLKYIGDAIFYLIVAFLSLIIVLSLTVTNGMIKTLGFGWYMVASDSMEPLIMTKDMVVAAKVNPDDLKPGDIIIFETWSILVTMVLYIHLSFIISMKLMNLDM